jgi:NAD(P)-dependent dehydrogenase (short-subunit alcohol dehydrogenase family)
MQNADSLFRLDGRVALVAGAASGIGRASAIGLSQAGATVICADINVTEAENTAKESGAGKSRAEAVALDITDEGAVESVVDSIRARHGQIDVLVVTPAVNVRKPLLNYSAAEFDRVSGLNLKGTFLIARAVARVMSAQKSGSIILLSSIRSVTTEPGQGVYAATKAGVVQLARTFAAELGPVGVRVNCIAPGVVETPLTQPIKNRPEWYDAYARKNALGRWASAEEMAGPVVFLASAAASYVTGAVLFVDGGWTAIDGRFQPPVG